MMTRRKILGLLGLAPVAAALPVAAEPKKYLLYVPLGETVSGPLSVELSPNKPIDPHSTPVFITVKVDGVERQIPVW